MLYHGSAGYSNPSNWYGHFSWFWPVFLLLSVSLSFIESCAIACLHEFLINSLFLSNQASCCDPVWCDRKCAEYGYIVSFMHTELTRCVTSCGAECFLTFKTLGSGWKSLSESLLPISTLAMMDIVELTNRQMELPLKALIHYYSVARQHERGQTQ